ncbi:hypothetical protein AB0D35_34060, partial [Streptomyces sp. NPDC048301]
LMLRSMMYVAMCSVPAYRRRRTASAAAPSACTPARGGGHNGHGGGATPPPGLWLEAFTQAVNGVPKEQQNGTDSDDAWDKGDEK